MLLPDVNVWLAMAIDSHQHHASARAWFNGLGDQNCTFCRVTQQGFLRPSTNAHASGKGVMTMAQAWIAYDLLRSDTRIGFTDEPIGIERAWRSFTQQSSYSPHLWNDAYLAAFSLLTGYELITFDRALGQFVGVSCTILT